MGQEKREAEASLFEFLREANLRSGWARVLGVHCDGRCDTGDGNCTQSNDQANMGA